MQDKNSEFLYVQALGRASYLGQLYDSATNTLLPGFRLFTADNIKPVVSPLNSTDISYKEIRNVKDRANSLNISASLQVDILGGTLSVGGMGSYLNNMDDTSESITVAAVAQYRTSAESLEINALRDSPAMSAADLNDTRATHAVVSISYGGNVVGSLTQKNNSFNSNTEVKGNFSLDVFKGLSKVAGGKGQSELDHGKVEKLNDYRLDVSLTADFSLAEEKVPATAPEMLDVFTRSARLVGHGVPCELTLSPLSMLDEVTPKFRELREVDLLEITDLFGRIITLGNSREWLVGLVEKQSDLFPSFLKTCKLRATKVTELVRLSKGELREYLQSYRTLSPDAKSPADFRLDVETKFAEGIQLYEADLEVWKHMVQRMRAGDLHGYPATSVSDLAGKMNRADGAYVAVMLVPEAVRFVHFLSAYRVGAEDIHTWRLAAQPYLKDGEGGRAKKQPATAYASVFAEKELESALLLLDDESKSLERALGKARETSTPIFLAYGPFHDGLGEELVWSVLDFNLDGWGRASHSADGWRYVGEVRNGLPHGSGMMTYPTHNARYIGEFVNGKPADHGEVVCANEGGIAKSGTEGDEKTVKISVVAFDENGDKVKLKKVTVDPRQAGRKVLERIADEMGWKADRRLRLEIGGMILTRQEGRFAIAEAQELASVLDFATVGAFMQGTVEVKAYYI